MGRPRAAISGFAIGLLHAGCGGADDASADGTNGSTADEGDGGGSAPSSAGSGDDADGSGSSPDGDGGGDGGGDDTAGPSGEPCGRYSPGEAFSVCAATYLGGGSDDAAGGVAIADDGTVIWVGTVVGDDLGVTATALAGGGDGVVVRFSSDGREVLGVSRIGGAVHDVAVLRGLDRIAVVGDFGVAVLDAGASQVVWSAALDGEESHVAAASTGHVAVLHGGTLDVFDGEGASTASVGIGGQANDVALHAGSGTVIVTGFKQDDGPPCTQLQIPYLRAFGIDGTPAWTGYDWTKDEVGAVDECADTRGIAVEIGGDGKLYYAGESHGGNTVHRRMPDAIEEMAPLVKFDEYNDPYNLSGAAPITFYARLDPETGALETGQHLVTRLSDGKGNAARPHAIAADASGNVFVTGGTACCIENGTSRTVNGEPAMPEAYQGGGFVLVVSPDFGQRLSWTTFRGETGNGETGVAIAAGANVAVAFDQTVDRGATTDSPLLTFDAVRAEPGGGMSDGWLAVWPAP